MTLAYYPGVPPIRGEYNKGVLHREGNQNKDNCDSPGFSVGLIIS